MKTIGLIGGMSWESTAQYYRLLNQQMLARTAGAHAAKIVAVSLDFGEIAPAMHRGDWQFVAERVSAAARALQRAGADFFFIASNTPHKVAPDVAAATSLPMLHIVDPTGAAIRSAGVRTAGLLGTAFTMQETFFHDRLGRFGIETLVPDPADQERCHAIIFAELVKGVTSAGARRDFAAIMGRLVDAGARGVILGCTEFMLLAKPEDCSVQMFDTTTLHAMAAVEAALDEAAFARLSAGAEGR